LPGHTPVHLGLHSVPRCQPRLLVFEVSECRLSLKCRGRVPGRGQWRGEGLLAAAATLGASCSADKEHCRLLRQRQRCLPLHQPHSATAHEACRDRPPLCQERVAIGDIRVLHVPMTSQFADNFTKGLPTSVFSEFWSSLNIRSG
jgi:hypothetical protein